MISFVKDAAGNNNAFQLVSNFATMMSYHFTSLEKFYPATGKIIADVYMQNGRIFKPRAANPNREANSFPGGSSTKTNCKIDNSITIDCY